MLLVGFLSSSIFGGIFEHESTFGVLKFVFMIFGGIFGIFGFIYLRNSILLRTKNSELSNIVDKLRNYEQDHSDDKAQLESLKTQFESSQIKLKEIQKQIDNLKDLISELYEKLEESFI